jgi:hypothetical protein
MSINTSKYSTTSQFGAKVIKNFIVPAGLVSVAIIGALTGITFVGGVVKVSDTRDEAVHILRERCVLSASGQELPVILSVPYGNARGVWIERPRVRTKADGTRDIVGDIMWVEGRTVKMADASEVKLVRCDL